MDQALVNDRNEAQRYLEHEVHSGGRRHPARMKLRVALPALDHLKLPRAPLQPHVHNRQRVALASMFGTIPSAPL